MAVDPKTYTRRTGGFWNIGLDPIVASIPHDEATRKAVRAASKGRLIAWDPVQRTAGLDHRISGAVERRTAVDRRRPAVPGHRPGQVHRL